MTAKAEIEGDLGYREALPGRELASANDWWGFGFLYGLSGVDPRGTRKTHRWYCGQSGAYEQFRQGCRFAQELEIAAVLGE